MIIVIEDGGINALLSNVITYIMSEQPGRPYNKTQRNVLVDNVFIFP